MSDSKRRAAAPDPLDFLAVDAELSDTERDIRDAVREFSTRELLPNVADWFEAGTLPDPRGLAKAFGDLGVLGMHLDGYSCGGSSAVAYGLACRELEAVDSGLRSFVSVQGSLAMAAIHKFGSEEHKNEWLAEKG
ncbi:acyl-CoA dehydrogenase family protein, partial [Nocardiopsis prasina]|uniref:acyl-CoA dehydrogenase family protein n=1 Tax=Nocardiopsis prasina TaxID=2015 RepID=UPI000476CC55